VVCALRLPILIGAFTLVALGSQTAAQLLDLPHRLPPGASTVTTLWAFGNVALIAYVWFWATGVQHRRRSHRFPVVLQAAYSADEAALPSMSGRVDDLSRHGARLIVDRARAPGERVRLVLLLEDGPVEVTGTVAIAKRVRRRRHWLVGVDFDPMDTGVGDTIISWCFRHPFGPGETVIPVGDGAAPVVPAPSLIAAAETAAAGDASPDPGPEAAGPSPA
jgi:hypothetical protein